jgi:glycosyltransferase involved in cell wall biosynthesis
MAKKNKICFVVSTLYTVQAFLENHIRQISDSFDVYIVANITKKDLEYLQTLPIKGYKHIGIDRKIQLGRDTKAVRDLSHYFRKEQFFAVHSITPKAGLVTALAGKLAGIKTRIHIFTGQVWASKKGLMRILLKSVDKLIAKLNTHSLVDGHSQREFLIGEKVLTETNSLVLANGSIAGVDTLKFGPDNSARTEIRNSLGIKDDQAVFIFLGRLCKDKGIDELLEAFSMLQKEYSNAFLLLVGPDEENYTEKIKNNYTNLVYKVNFCLYGLTTTPARLLNAGDVFCLPSYREGFGMSVIEASSSGLAAIVSDAYGLRDAIVPEVTGLVCKIQDVESLYKGMKFLMENPDYMELLGKNGRDYIQRKFSQADVSKAWVDFYLSLT